MIVPNSKPQLKKEEVDNLLHNFKVTSSEYPVKLLAIRGYYKETMGNPAKNDIGIYDDACFVVTDDFFASFNFNTDPSRAIQGVAVLKPGMYLYKVGLHGLHHLDMKSSKDANIYDQLIKTRKDVAVVGRPVPYWALRQYSDVTVLRDGVEYTDNKDQRFWIDIHKGGYGTTSSLGCQTVYPDQWKDFFWRTVKNLMDKNNQQVIPYCLVEY